MLKLDPKNTELLAQKQKVLSDNIKETTERIKVLKNAQEQFIKSGGDLNSAEYRNLQREIINTENKLKQLNIEASKWTDASRNLSNLSDKMKSLGTAVQDVGKKASVVSAAIAGLFTVGVKYNAEIETSTRAFETFIGNAEDAAEAIEKIRKASEKSPFDTKELIRANQLLITTGEDADDVRNTISALADAIALTGGSNDELSRMASNLQQIKNAGKATSMDIRQFAYAGIDVYGILAETTGKNVEELKKMDITYEELSKALQVAASEGGKYYQGQEKMADTLNGKINQLKKTFTDLLGELSESLMPTINKLTEGLKGIVDWFKALDPQQKEMITKIGLALVALGPALLIIGKLITAGGIIVGLAAKVAAKIAVMSAGTSAFSGVIAALTGPVGIVIGVITALSAALVYLYNTNEDVKKKVQETWQNIVDLFNTYVMPLIESIRDLIMSVVKTIMDLFKKLWGYIEPLVTKMLTWMMDFWNNTLSKIVANVLSFVTELVNFVKDIWNNVISPIVNFLVDILAPVFAWVFEKIGSIVGGTFETIGNLVKAITGIFDGLIKFITGVFTGNWSKAWEGVVSIFKNIVDGLWTIIKIPLNLIITGINALIKGLNLLKVPDWVPGIGGKGINIPLIPKLAKGGIVDDATLAMIGEGRTAEAVIPLDRTLTKYMAEAMRQAGGNRTITVNFYPKQMTEAELEMAFDYVDKRYGMSY